MLSKTSNGNILVLVGSTNPVKALAARKGIIETHPGVNVEVRFFKADPGITDWKSSRAIGQPFGLEQTRCGAVNRMQDCWRQAEEQFSGDRQRAISTNLALTRKIQRLEKHIARLETARKSSRKGKRGRAKRVSLDSQKKSLQRLRDQEKTKAMKVAKQWSHIYVVAFENGLVEEENSENWYDTCFVAVRDARSDKAVVMQGAAILTEFGCQDGEKMSFDEQVEKYQRIFHSITQKTGGDPYPVWTENMEGGPYTRDFFLKKCLATAVNQLLLTTKAEDLVEGCARGGAAASIGIRYRNMCWMRDLAYMNPAYLAEGYETAVCEALKELCKHQCQVHESYRNGYEILNRFGNMPIVCVSDDGERDFLMQRIRGTEEDPYWQIQLWEYCKNKKPGALSRFPIPGGGVCGSDDTHVPSLVGCQVKDLREYYEQLLNFRNRLAETVDSNEDKPPTPSFALRSFMKGTLSDLTPGTRDSEIQFIRALLCLVECKEKRDGQVLLMDFAKPLAGALFFLHMNVIDAEDGLPRGCDSRDIFADLLYDAKTLTNAVFWYEALKGLLNQADALENTLIRQHIAEAIDNHLTCFGAGFQTIPKILLEMAHHKSEEGIRSFSEILSEAVKKLESAIKNTLLRENEHFSPRDFMPGKRAELGLTSPKTPSPAIPIILKNNREFVLGNSVDPQSLAHAVLNGLISEEHYIQVLECFRAQDSQIGVTVFVPISGKTEEETELLRNVKGRVVWPHVTWAVVRALIYMGTPESIKMAEEQREKLINLLGLGEWYAVDSSDRHVIQGGNPQQGWAASGLLMAIKAFEEAEKGREKGRDRHLAIGSDLLLIGADIIGPCQKL